MSVAQTAGQAKLGLPAGHVMSICQLASGLICLYQSLLPTGQLTSAQDRETPPQRPASNANTRYGRAMLVFHLTNQML